MSTSVFKRYCLIFIFFPTLTFGCVEIWNWSGKGAVIKPHQFNANITFSLGVGTKRKVRKYINRNYVNYQSFNVITNIDGKEFIFSINEFYDGLYIFRTEEAKYPSRQLGLFYKINLKPFDGREDIVKKLKKIKPIVIDGRRK